MKEDIGKAVGFVVLIKEQKKEGISSSKGPNKGVLVWILFQECLVRGFVAEKLAWRQLIRRGSGLFSSNLDIEDDLYLHLF